MPLTSAQESLQIEVGFQRWQASSTGGGSGLLCCDRHARCRRETRAGWLCGRLQGHVRLGSHPGLSEPNRERLNSVLCQEKLVRLDIRDKSVGAARLPGWLAQRCVADPTWLFGTEEASTPV